MSNGKQPTNDFIAHYPSPITRFDGGENSEARETDGTGPYKVEVGTETKFICGCGLSRNQPFCDGTHKTTARTGPEGSLFWYDADGNRHDCEDRFPGIRSA